MDIFLDSNVYLADIRLRSNRFANFFDYVRRTRSRLLLPALVRDEVLQKQREKISAQLSRVEKELKELGRYTVKNPRFDAPYLNGEISDLRRLLRNPSNSVRTHFLASTEGVDLKEVIRRGIKRVPPASKSGEELRDVVLWLLVLAHTKSTSRRTAFVTADGGFWDSDKPKNQILEDIASQNLDILLYRDLADFTKDNALISEAATQAWVEDHLKTIKLGEIIADSVRHSLKSKTRQVSGSIEKVATSRMEFISGTIYKIDAKADFAELWYRGFFTAESATVRYPNSLSPFYGVPSFEGAGLGSLTNLSALLGLQPGFSAQYGALQGKGTETVRNTYDVEAEIRLFRLEAGKTELEIDDVKPIKVSPVT